MVSDHAVCDRVCGYTNATRQLAGGHIEKRYEGPGRAERYRCEIACLLRLRGHLPLPEVVSHDVARPSLVVGELAGRHGQELVDEGDARLVMGLVGSTLRKLHALPTETVPDFPGQGTVLVHGDFGPQNMLFDPVAGRVTAVLDWESAHVGEPVEDLAWAEWIVRMHHADHVDAVEDLLAQSGVAASWTDRQAAMVRRCHQIPRLAETPEAEAMWHARLAATEAWVDT